MSGTTLQLFFSFDFLFWVVIGSLAALAAVAWGALTSRPTPIGGLLLSGGAVVALLLSRRVPMMLVLGLILLAVAGLVSQRALLAGMAAAIPGAIAIGVASLGNPRPEFIIIVVTAIVASVPLVASFDEHYRTSALAMPLMAIAFVGVFFTIPDTEEAIVAVGAALPFALLGPGGRFANLGRPGAFACVGLLVWVVASGGSSRPVLLILGVATLGLLLAEPVARRVSAAQPTHADRPLGLGVRGVGVVIAVQIVVGFAMSRLASIAGGRVLIVAGIAVLVLALAGWWASTPVPDD